MRRFGAWREGHELETKRKVSSLATGVLPWVRSCLLDVDSRAPGKGMAQRSISRTLPRIDASYRFAFPSALPCLLPDHLHLVWMGLRQQSDQLNAMKFLRTHLEPDLGDQRQWQHQPHDRVPEERQRNAFAQTCAYILANPVRAQLVKNERDWPYSGAIVPGYPELNPFDRKFWPIFWKIYERERNAGGKSGAAEVQNV